MIDNSRIDLSYHRGAKIASRRKNTWGLNRACNKEAFFHRRKVAKGMIYAVRK